VHVRTDLEITKKLGRYMGKSANEIEQNFGGVYKPMQTGYGGGKATRVTDRFVRYPYPSN